MKFFSKLLRLMIEPSRFITDFLDYDSPTSLTGQWLIWQCWDLFPSRSVCWSRPGISCWPDCEWGGRRTWTGTSLGWRNRRWSRSQWNSSWLLCSGRGHRRRRPRCCLWRWTTRTSSQVLSCPFVQEMGVVFEIQLTNGIWQLFEKNVNSQSSVARFKVRLLEARTLFFHKFSWSGRRKEYFSSSVSFSLASYIDICHLGQLTPTKKAHILNK